MRNPNVGRASGITSSRGASASRTASPNLAVALSKLSAQSGANGTGAVISGDFKGGTAPMQSGPSGKPE